MRYRVRFRPFREFDREITFEAQGDDYAELIAWNDHRRPSDSSRTMIISREIDGAWQDVSKWTPKAKHWIHPLRKGTGRHAKPFSTPRALDS